MSILKHDFTDKIIAILDRHTNNSGDLALRNCEIIQYLNIKTKAANRGSNPPASELLKKIPYIKIGIPFMKLYNWWKKRKQRNKNGNKKSNMRS